MGGPLQSKQPRFFSAASPRTCAEECQNTFLAAKQHQSELNKLRSLLEGLEAAYPLSLRSQAVSRNRTSLEVDPDPRAHHPPLLLLSVQKETLIETEQYSPALSPRTSQYMFGRQVMLR